MRLKIQVLGLVLLPVLITSCSDSTVPSATNNAPKAETPQARLEELNRQAQTGNPVAQFDLGMMYAKGEGVPENAVKAAEWIQKAAAQGNAKAQAVLGKM